MCHGLCRLLLSAESQMIPFLSFVISYQFPTILKPHKEWKNLPRLVKCNCCMWTVSEWWVWDASSVFLCLLSYHFPTILIRLCKIARIFPDCNLIVTLLSCWLGSYCWSFSPQTQAVLSDSLLGVAASSTTAATAAAAAAAAASHSLRQHPQLQRQDAPFYSNLVAIVHEAF